MVGFDRGPLLQGHTRILHLQHFFKYVLTYSLHLNSYLVTFLYNTICRAQLFCPFLLSGSEFLLNMLFNYHLLYFCTALSLIIMLSSHYYLHKSKTLSQLTQCPFTGTLLLFMSISISFQGALEITSVIGQPPSLVADHFSSPRVVPESHKRDEGYRPSSLRPQYANLYRSLKRRLGCSFRTSSTKVCGRTGIKGYS